MGNLLLALFLGSIGSVTLAGGLLFLSDNTLTRVANYLISLAGGTLLGAAFLGMLPKAISTAMPSNVLTTTLLGILVLFILEKIILWHRCSNKNCERHHDASAQLILLGDAFHNFVDGVIIAAAFLTSSTFGWFVALSVLAHEIPQELSDFGILIKSGFSRRKALWYNLVSGSTAIPAGIMAYYAIDAANSSLPWVLSLSAASFIYIALADLVPQMHKKTSLNDSIFQVLLIILGVSIIYFFKNH